MKMTLKSTLALTLATFFLTGCASMNLFKDDPAPASQSADLAPEEPMESPTLAPSTLTAAQISKALSGKSWKWSTPTIRGVTLYANDGSSLVDVTGKGTTTGKWLAKDGQLCESMAPAPFLPKGKSMFCNPISMNGTGYKVGPANFTLAN